MDNLIIRKLELGDLSKGYFETLANLYWVGLSLVEAKPIFEEMDVNPVYHHLVAELDGQIVGAVTLLVERKFILRGSKYWHIENMAVRKEFERRGIGRKLIKAAAEEGHAETALRELAEETGLKPLSVIVLKDICPEPDWFPRGTAVVAIEIDPANLPLGFAGVSLNNLAATLAIDSATSLAALMRFMAWMRVNH